MKKVLIILLALLITSAFAMSESVTKIVTGDCYDSKGVVVGSWYSEWVYDKDGNPTNGWGINCKGVIWEWPPKKDLISNDSITIIGNTIEIHAPTPVLYAIAADLATFNGVYLPYTGAIDISGLMPGWYRLIVKNNGFIETFNIIK